MKLTRENYELILFDLLEGQIPESERATLMEQIEADYFYKGEWEMLQNTILVPDMDTVYPAKGKLKKTIAPIIPLNGWYTIGIAASILLIAAFYFSTTPGNDLSAPDRIASELPGSAESSQPTRSYPRQIEVESSTAATEGSTAETRPAAQDPSNHPASAQYAVASSVVTPETSVDHVQELAVEQFSLRNASKGLTGFAQPNQPSMNGTLSSSNVDYLAMTPVTYTAFDRMVGKAARTMVNLSNPNLEVQPDWKNRSLDITLETDGYSAFASITPFNN